MRLIFTSKRLHSKIGRSFYNANVSKSIYTHILERIQIFSFTLSDMHNIRRNIRNANFLLFILSLNTSLGRARSR